VRLLTNLQKWMCSSSSGSSATISSSSGGGSHGGEGEGAETFVSIAAPTPVPASAPAPVGESGPLEPSQLALLLVLVEATVPPQQHASLAALRTRDW